MSKTSTQKSLKWSVAYQIEGAKAATHSIFRTRGEARKHKRGMEDLLKSIPNKNNYKMWLERHETVYHHEDGKRSFTITNVSRIR